MIMIPNSLKAKLLILIILLAGLPILFSGYFIAETAIRATVAEKQEKLFGAARLLDRQLIGTYDDILRKHHAENACRETQIRILNENLERFTDEVALAYPGIGVGYYHRRLDAIITYGPSSVYSDKVGLPISENHQGRAVMSTGMPRVQEGNLVRGQIMNAMHPIIRNGEIIGYIWANELAVNIETQIKAIARHIYWTMLGGLVVGITGIVYVINRLMADIDRIKGGLIKIRENLSYRIIPPGGEIGEIATAINEMASSLAEKKKLEEQVQRADRLALIGELVAGLAHEIRNPLMAIKGFAELQGETDIQEKKQEYTEIIVREANRMDKLIERLLCFSRPGSDLITSVDLNEVLKNTLVLAEMRASGMEVVFEHNLAQYLPNIIANEEQLRQVFLNILINAIQAMDKKGMIRVSTFYDGDNGSVCASFTDTGPGIAPENITKLFDPFFTTKVNGTGLGLSVARHLMASWGGTISVTSVLHEGSTFTLCFPVIRREDCDSHAHA
jgi:two-component system sensor histidine kinase HydH